MWRKLFSAFLGNDKELRLIFGWHSLTPQRLDCTTARRKTQPTTLDLITTTCPFQKKFNIFKQVIQNEFSPFPRHLGKI